jgi:hypothetical protein
MQTKNDGRAHGKIHEMPRAARIRVEKRVQREEDEDVHSVDRLTVSEFLL